jgi:hypothetical protein
VVIELASWNNSPLWTFAHPNSFDGRTVVIVKRAAGNRQVIGYGGRLRQSSFSDLLGIGCPNTALSGDRAAGSSDSIAAVVSRIKNQIGV